MAYAYAYADAETCACACAYADACTHACTGGHTAIESLWPSARSGHSLSALPKAYGPAAAAAVAPPLFLFGGVSTQLGLLQDLWVYHSTPPVDPSDSHAPPCLAAHGHGCWQRLLAGYSSAFSPSFGPALQSVGYQSVGYGASAEPLPSLEQAALGNGGFPGFQAGGWGDSYGLFGSYGPCARTAHAAVMIATPSAADGATAILLVLGGIGYTSAMPEYDDDRHRRRAAAESEGEGGGSFGRPALNLYAPSDGLPSSFRVLPDVWQLRIGAEVAGGTGHWAWRPMAWRHGRTGAVPAARYGHTATELPDGSILVFGGMKASAGGVGKSITTPSADAWRFEQIHGRGNGVWAPVPKGKKTPTGEVEEWPRGRAYHVATRASDTVVIFGGRHLREGGGQGQGQG